MPASTIGRSLVEGLQARQNLLAGQRQEAESERLDKARNLLGGLIGGGLGQGQLQSQQFQQLAQADPNLALQYRGLVEQERAQFEALNENRKKATYQDASSVNRLLKSNRPDLAANLLGQRGRFIEQLGGNPNGTNEVATLIAEGRTQEAIELLNLVEAEGRQRGYLETPEVVKKEQGKGGLVFDPVSGTYSADPVAVARFDALNKKQNQQGLTAKDRQSINKDITGFTKEAVSIRNTAEDLIKLKELNSGPASIAAVFKFMKALDPDSVVREGEFATAENSAGVPEALRNTYNRILSGERLGDVQFQQFIDTAKQVANTAISSSQDVVSGYLNTFEDTLPKTFVNRVRARVPQQFEITTGNDKDKPGFKVISVSNR